MKKAQKTDEIVTITLTKEFCAAFADFLHSVAVCEDMGAGMNLASLFSHAAEVGRADLTHLNVPENNLDGTGAPTKEGYDAFSSLLQKEEKRLARICRKFQARKV